MEFTFFVLKGLGTALLVGVVGVLLVALGEIVLAYRDPGRSAVIRQRTWRENLHHMLH